MRRKKDKAAAQIKAVIEKSLDLFNYTPVGYEHSKEYIAISADREGWVERELKGVPIDELSGDTLDSFINAMADEECSHINKQFTIHIQTIKSIVDSCRGVITRTNNILAHLEADKNKYIKELESLRKLRYLEGGNNSEKEKE